MRELLILSFLLQIFGCLTFRKGIKKMEGDLEIKQEFRRSLKIFLAALFFQFIVLITVLFAHYYLLPSVRKNYMRPIEQSEIFRQEFRGQYT